MFGGKKTYTKEEVLDLLKDTTTEVMTELETENTNIDDAMIRLLHTMIQLQFSSALLSKIHKKLGE